MRGPWLLLAAALWPLAVPGQEVSIEAPRPVLGVGEYATALDGLRASLESGRLDEARRGAGQLAGAEVAWSGGTFVADVTVLDEVARGSSTAEAGVQAARLRRLVAALKGADGSGAVDGPDPGVLARVTPRSTIEKGGEAPGLRTRPLTFPRWVERALVAAGDWIADTYRKLTDWLRRFWPTRTRVDQEDTGTTALAAMAFAAVVVALLAVLAVRSLLRGRGPSTAGVSSAVRWSSRDEDPLSRETSEWEVYARQLAGERRWREAIRAWYHAVLVALFQTGLLHHQTGRTNWEYVSQLPPRLPWRPGFVSLTRRFDREWYGRRSSDGGALADCAREAQGLLRAVRDRGDTA